VDVATLLEGMPPKLSKAAEDSNLRSMTSIELERKMVEYANRMPGNLTGYDCPVCMNRGYFAEVREEFGHVYRFSRECECMKIRRSLQAIRRSGLAPLLDQCTFDTWQEKEPWQRRAKELALAYAEKPEGWFVMAGGVGAGKTHLCTALCGKLLKCGMPVQYSLWRDLVVRAKALVNDDEGYQAVVGPLKRVKVLYIDDLLKAGGRKITDADVNLAFELLNNRSISGLPTIISSELTLEDITAIDAATGSRIYWNSRNYYMSLRGRKNWRLDG